MRIVLTLQCPFPQTVIPANYQYPLSAAIYKIISRADEAYAQFLHDEGYGLNGHKRFKLFNFSSLQVPYYMQGDRMVLRETAAQLIAGFQVPKAAENFIEGLFKQQQLEVADHHSRAVFTITSVECLPPVPAAEPGAMVRALLQPLSPLVCGYKNERGNYTFLSPEDPQFLHWLCQNLNEKLELAEIPGVTPAFFEVRRPPHGPKSRLITIKAGTSAETRIKGYVQFELDLTAPAAVLQTILNCGLGLYNAQGMGCMGVVEIVPFQKSDSLWVTKQIYTP